MIITTTRRLAPVSAVQLLQYLKPTRKILSAVVVHNKRTTIIGLAVSDPYLSHAVPLTSVPWLASSPPPGNVLLDIAQAENAEALVLGLPISDSNNNNNDDDDITWRDELLHHLLLTTTTTKMLINVSNVPPGNWAYIIEEHRRNLLWDSLPVDDKSLLVADDDDSFDTSSIHAGVALQMWLDEHVGGWKNTFG